MSRNFERGMPTRYARHHLKLLRFNQVKTGGDNMYSNSTLDFCHKVSIFTTLQDMWNSLQEFWLSRMKMVDNTSRTWPSVTFWIIKDKGHAFLDSKIVRKTKNRWARVVSYVSGHWKTCAIEDNHGALKTITAKLEGNPMSKNEDDCIPRLLWN